MPKRAPTEIICVTTTEQWQAYHRIRRQVLYEDRGRFGVYDENHPDDYRIGHFPLLILASGQPVGAARLDCVPGSLGIVRSVAISPEFQRMGFGRSLMIGLEQHAANLGMRSLEVNSAPDAVGFYEKLGWVLVDRQRSSPLLRKASRSGNLICKTQDFLHNAKCLVISAKFSWERVLARGDLT